MTQIKHKRLLNVSGLTDTGFVREKNEDYFDIDRNNNIFIVADGIGGARGGEVASRITVEIIYKTIIETIAKERQNTVISYPLIIMDAVQKANDAVIEAAAKDGNLTGMGSTVVLAVLEPPDVLHVANVGDSRCYLYRNGQLILATQNHSLVGELVRSGELTDEEARLNMMRNIITQAIGTNSVMRPYQKKITLYNGDIIILCTDGLWDMLSNKEIRDIVSGINEPKRLCSLLIDAANKAGGEDNITVIVISKNA